MSQSWKLTLPCTRAEAEALGQDLGVLADLPVPPVLMTSEAVEDDPACWRLDAYFEGKPGARLIRMVQALVPSSAGTKALLEKLPDEDWVTLSQQGLEPVTAGRFHVRNRVDAPVPSGLVPLLIPAGRAFGTGQHETTGGCLAMLDRCRNLGHRFGNIADIGTGTGLLAFAAHHLWPMAYLTASDIDQAAVAVTVENAAANSVRAGRGMGQIAAYEAPGASHAAIQTRAPYDCVIANILAGPLIELAPALCALLEPGGTLILAGLLEDQAQRVLAAYRHEGMRIADRIDNGHWPTLRLRKRPAIGWKRPRRWSPEKIGEAPGFGSW
jgi:ribosomal protein L11 methyltransferase